MANTYTQIYIHIVFAVEHRQNIIPKEHKDEIHQYITGIVPNKKQKVIQINSMPDHIHILIGIDPNVADYIKNQETRHAHKSFREEYIEILKRFNIDYDERYIFDSIDPDDC